MSVSNGGINDDYDVDISGGRSGAPPSSPSSSAGSSSSSSGAAVSTTATAGSSTSTPATDVPAPPSPTAGAASGGAGDGARGAGFGGLAGDGVFDEERSLNTRAFLAAKVRAALAAEFGPEFADADPMVTLATRPEHGDYQCNAAMRLGKALKAKPRDIAERLAAALRPCLLGVCEEPQIAGPGFINLRLAAEFVAGQVNNMLADRSGKLGVPPPAVAQRVVVDFSSPNIAKEMHVGHLRSTIIGDTLCRVLEFLGHRVLRLNHVGDWGTQFGMLILYLKESAPEVLQEAGPRAPMELGDLVEFYRRAKQRFDADEAFQRDARAEVTRLQSGDEESVRAWNMLCEQSRCEFDKIYAMLGVRIIERGESFYNPLLPEVVGTLQAAGLAVEDGGAMCVFLEGYKNREGNAQPLIVRKSDGGYMYSTTDLAAIRYRVGEDGAQRVLYLTDAGQATHFAQVFQVARRAGFYDPQRTSLEHVPFGLVLGEDGKKFKTRSGETVKLKELLDRAVELAEQDLRTRLAEQPERRESDEYIRQTAFAIGIGAVKYADLKTNRTSDYRFSYQKMLSLSGNTAPFMMYAFSRVSGIARKAAGQAPDAEIDLRELMDTCAGKVALAEPAEAWLARHLIRLPEVLAEVERELMPHELCEYLFELSQRFNQFYEQCQVVGAEGDSVRESRLGLCALTGGVLERGLGLLGIDVCARI